MNKITQLPPKLNVIPTLPLAGNPVEKNQLTRFESAVKIDPWGQLTKLVLGICPDPSL